MKMLKNVFALKLSLWKVDRFTSNQDQNDPRPILHVFFR